VTDKFGEDIARANRAKALLSDDLLSGAFKTLREAYLTAWESTKYNDTDGRERLWQAVQIVGKVQAQLTSYVNDGRLAQAELDRINYGMRDRPAA
jgi:hypothetical protein